MLGASPNTALVAFLALAGSLLAAEGADARRRQQQARCGGDARIVTPGTPAYGGPGLGYEVTHVFGRRTCAKVMRTTEDGRFALVVLGPGKVAWVPTGLVEADLSEAEGAKPTDLEEPKKLVAMRVLALRRQPRFDAKAVATVPKGSEVTVTGRSPDGLWWFAKAGADQGWISRYQAQEALPEEGAAPTAGAGDWVVRPLAPEKAPPAAAVEKAKKNQQEAADKAPDGKTAGGAEPDEATPEGAGEAAGEPGAPPARLLGRGDEVGFGVSVGSWSQRYLSDAQNDAFHRYELSSTGPAGFLSYAHRGDFPLVGEVYAQAGLFGFDLAPPGEAEPLYTSVVTGQLYGQLGWRLYGDDDVDVEAGAGAGVQVVWVGDLEAADGRIDAFTPGLYLDALRPYVAARTRLGGGDFGLVSFEAAMPLGGYVMVYDPGGKYLETKPPVLDPPTPPRLADPDPDAEPEEDPEPPVLHPSVGLEGRVRYALPLGDVVRLRLSAGLGVRQAFLTGPGIRAEGVYANATNIDVVGSLDLGVDFNF